MDKYFGSLEYLGIWSYPFIHMILKTPAIHSAANHQNQALCSPNEAQSDGLPRRDACRDVFPTLGVDFPNCWGKQVTTHHNNLKDFLCSPLPEEMIHFDYIIFFQMDWTAILEGTEKKNKKAVAKQKSPWPDICFVDARRAFLSTPRLSGRSTKTVDQRCGWKAWMRHSKLKYTPRKITWQKNNHLKMYSLLIVVFFHCHVSFQGGL